MQPRRLSTLVTALLVNVSAAHADSGLEVHWSAPAVHELVITAERTSSPLEVVSDPRLPRQPVPAHDGADYLKTIPGFAIIRKGGTSGDAVFRGMAASRVALIADGGTLHGGCAMRMDPPTAYLFPQSYDRIRVLKGPQSVLWGPGSSAATVIFERDPFNADTDGNELYLSAMTSSWGRHDLALDGQAGSSLGYLRLQGSDSRSGHYKDGDGNEVHSRYHRWNGHLTIGWTPREGTLVEVNTAASDGEAAYADRMMDGSLFRREHYGLRLRQDFNHRLLSSVEARLSWNYVDHVMDNYSVRPFSASMMMPHLQASNPDRTTINARVSATLTPSANSDMELGVDLERNRHTIRSTHNQLAVPYRSLNREHDARFVQMGIFGEWEYRPAPGHTWTSGLRLDRWSVHDDRDTVSIDSMGMASLPNPTAGQRDRDLLPSAFVRYEHALGDHHHDHHSTLFIGLGHTQRIADYWERIGNDRQSPLGRSAFFSEPEKTTQLDWGLIHEADRYRVAASLFYNRVHDFILIDTAYPGKEGVGVTRNVRAHSFGGELELARDLGRHWLAEATLAYTRGYNDTDHTPLGQIPPLEARLSLTWQYDDWSVGGLLRLVDSQHRVDIGRGNIAGQDVRKTSGYAVFSLNASYQASEQLQLSAGVDNLLDRSYAEHLSRAGATVPGFVTTGQVNEPGRLLWARLAWSWK